jgi:hypothetical protein
LHETKNFESRLVPAEKPSREAARRALNRALPLRKTLTLDGLKVKDSIEVSKLDAFLKFNEYEALTNAGSVSIEVAKHLAEEQYETFRVQQDQRFESDFEKEIKQIEKKKTKRKDSSE